jgi:hypothetical protein
VGVTSLLVYQSGLVTSTDRLAGVVESRRWTPVIRDEADESANFPVPI